MFKYGLIMQNTKASGDKIKLTEEENFGMPMEIFMKGSGKTTKQTDMESTFMSMVHSMKAIGKMIFKMVKEWNLGRMEANMMVVTKKA